MDCVDSIADARYPLGPRLSIQPTTLDDGRTADSELQWQTISNERSLVERSSRRRPYVGGVFVRRMFDHDPGAIFVSTLGAWPATSLADSSWLVLRDRFVWMVWN